MRRDRPRRSHRRTPDGDGHVAAARRAASLRQLEELGADRRGHRDGGGDARDLGREQTDERRPCPRLSAGDRGGEGECGDDPQVARPARRSTAPA